MLNIHLRAVGVRRGCVQIEMKTRKWLAADNGGEQSRNSSVSGVVVSVII
jgi:hypothetical protein